MKNTFLGTVLFAAIATSSAFADFGGGNPARLCRGTYHGALIINGVRTPLSIQLLGNRARVHLNGNTSNASVYCDQERGSAYIEITMAPFPTYSGDITARGRTAWMYLEGDGGKQVEASRPL